MSLHITRLSSSLAIATTLMWSAFPALAEEPFPLLKDVVKHENLPEKLSFDIRGFTLLSTFEAIEELKSEFPESDYHWNLRTETRGLRDGRGNEVSFNYGPTTYIIKRKQGFENYHVHFTSGLLGNKVYSVDLNTSFPDQVSLDALLSAFNKKFGLASFSGNSFGNYEIGYLFENGEQLFVDFQEYKTNKYKNPDARRVWDCFTAQSDAPSVGSLRPYQFKENRSRRHPQCNGGVYVSLRLGAREDLVQQMTIHVWDGDLAFENDTTQDIFLLEELLRTTANKEGSAAPKL